MKVERINIRIDSAPSRHNYSPPTVTPDWWSRYLAAFERILKAKVEKKFRNNLVTTRPCDDPSSQLVDGIFIPEGFEGRQSDNEAMYYSLAESKSEAVKEALDEAYSTKN